LWRSGTRSRRCSAPTTCCGKAGAKDFGTSRYRALQHAVPGRWSGEVEVVADAGERLQSGGGYLIEQFSRVAEPLGEGSAHLEVVGVLRSLCNLSVYLLHPALEFLLVDMDGHGRV
jgi:hypothetical protein